MSKLNSGNRRTGAQLTLSCLVGLGVVAVAQNSRATPGAHPPLFSTSDSRASSVVLAYRQSLGALTARMISYNANFSSTGGLLSAQFGAHVLQLQESAGDNTLYGAGATGTAVWNIPLMSRYENGVASVALMVYAGGAPVAAVSGERNFLNVPIGIGLGVPLSPKPWVTFTPWLEAAPGLDLDTTIRQPDLSPFEPDEQDLQDILNDEDAVIVSEDEVRQAITDAVVVDLAFEMAMRAGLDVTLRASDSWSFNVNSYFTSLGTAFGGQSYFYLGAGVLFHWDDVVPSVLPAAKRLERESCDDIEARFRMCSPQQVQSVCAAKTAAPAVNASVQPGTSVAPPPVVTEPPTPLLAPAPAGEGTSVPPAGGALDADTKATDLPSTTPAVNPENQQVPPLGATSATPGSAANPVSPQGSAAPPVTTPTNMAPPAAPTAPKPTPETPVTKAPAAKAPVAPAQPAPTPAVPSPPPAAPEAPKGQLPNTNSPY